MNLRISLYSSTLFLAAIIMITSGYAQEAENPNRERMEAYRVAFITEKLNLNSEEAQRFWPIYNEFDRQLREIKKKQRLLIKEINMTADKSDGIAEKHIAQLLNLKNQESELVRRYVVEFKKVLPAYKVAILLSLDEQFKSHVLKQMQQRHNKAISK